MNKSGTVTGRAMSRKRNFTEVSKPVVKLIGQDGNVFAIISACSAALTYAGLKVEADQFRAAAFASKSYDEEVE